MQRILIAFILFVVPFIAAAQQTDVRFEVVSGGELLLHRETPACKDIKYGFEGGRVVKVGNMYHLFTAEMTGDPYWVKMRLGHWKSSDGIDWQRAGTIRESDADFTGSSQRAAMWSPMVVFNEDDECWHIVYVCYKTKPNEPNIFYTGYDGIIQHAVSTVKGIEGIDGPYEDTNVLMRYDDNPKDAWEGLQGVDSFFPYRIGKKWYGFYGSATTQDFANCKWQIGLAQADRLEGPWTRMSELNPVDLKSNAENPIVFQLDNGTYIAIIDGVGDGMRYTLSQNGVKWSESRLFEMEPTVKKWWSSLRTPLSLLKEPDGTYTMYFTAYKQRFGTLSKVKLKMLP